MFQDGQALMAEKPDTEAMVKEKLASLTTMWDDLESTTQTKAKCLFDANKAELFTQSCADLDKWMVSLDGQLQSDDYGKDLTSVNILLKKQQVRRRRRSKLTHAQTGQQRMFCVEHVEVLAKTLSFI